jgi:GAF domain
MCSVNLDQQFMAAVIEAHDAHASAGEVLPMLLAQACVEVLRVTGAGVSITDGVRVPLGASDATAARAEALQSTLGEGPCLDATATSEPLVVGETSMAARWPMFHRELLAQTPFRSVASIPLKSSQPQRFGALDLYSVDPDALQRLNLREVARNVADPMAAILFDTPHTISHEGTLLPRWMTSPPVTQRMNVWVAVGILIEHSGLTNADALAAIRGYAYGHSASLDDIADHLTTRRLQPDALLA